MSSVGHLYKVLRNLVENSFSSIARALDQRHLTNFTLVPLPFGAPTICPFSHFNYQLQQTFQNTSYLLGLTPIDTSMHVGSLSVRNCSLNFPVEHWFGCRAPDPGYEGDVGAVEIWLIDWLIDCTTWELCPLNVLHFCDSMELKKLKCNVLWMTVLHIKDLACSPGEEFPKRFTQHDGTHRSPNVIQIRLFCSSAVYKCKCKL